jgi:hypothetical protein
LPLLSLPPGIIEHIDDNKTSAADAASFFDLARADADGPPYRTTIEDLDGFDPSIWGWR